MKLLFIGYLHGFGGAEKQIIKLANEMAKRNYDVTFISLYKNNECYKIDKDVKKIHIPDKRKGIVKIFYRHINLKSEIKKIKPDIIINFWFQSAYLTTFMPKKYTGKLIYSERGDPSDKEYNGIMGIIRKISFKKIDGLVFQTETAKNYFDYEVAKKSVVIHNPIMIKKGEYKIPEKREKRIVTVGRLHEQKNHKFLIDVFNKFSKKYADYVLEIYGDGALHDELNNYIKNLNLQDKVKLMGSRENIFECILNSKMFILPSLYEGMPNSLLEAMSLGIPVISYDYSPKKSVYEFIQNGINGFVYENENELLEQMEKVILDDNLANKISSNATNICNENSKEKIYDAWEKFFKEML